MKVNSILTFSFLAEELGVQYHQQPSPEYEESQEDLQMGSVWLAEEIKVRDLQFARFKKQ